jgi:xanthine/CO dehydrogenase XdhC/CoxF family maturation factor
MDRRETERILAAIRQARHIGTRVALATVVGVKGNAYRREGARIVVREDGSFECLLSGGCLEPAVADVAARVIQTGEPALVEYDLAEDSVWSLGVGCSGAVDVRIERVENDPLTSAWLDGLERGDAAVLITALSGEPGRLLVRDDGHAIGGLADARLEADAIAEAEQRLRLPTLQSGSLQMGAVRLFFEISEPPPELVIFGAGPDAIPLARHGRELGFLVTVVDPRAAMATAERFPDATLRAAHYTDFADTVPLTRRSHVVVMNHHLERDAESLRYALASEAAYIGVLGPRARYDKLIARLQSDGALLDADSLARVRNPIGLALGAETPEEIALAILAETIALRRGFDGGFLSGRQTSLHRPEPGTLYAAASGLRVQR